jgi:hypothetical protein
MTLQDQLLQLQQQLPDFWSKQLEESSFLQTLMLAYSYPYGSALQKWQTVANLTSPYTADPYLTDYYKVIDIRNAITPSDPQLSTGDNPSLYFELPLNTINIDTFCRDLTFTNSLPYYIYYDILLNKTLLAVIASNFLSTDRYFYIRQYDVDNGNMAKTWGALFPGIQPYFDSSLFNITSTINSFGFIINSDIYIQYLLNVKAQIINLIRCANSQGSIDALESLISVALNNPYVTADGTIVSFDSGNTWIEINGSVVQFTVPPKPKFSQQNQPIKAYEAPGICPIEFKSWCTDPNIFTQGLLQNYASELFTLLTLETNEVPIALYYDKAGLNLDPTYNPYTFDFGILINQEQFNPSTTYGDIQYGATYSGFEDWSNPGLDPTVYEFFKNVMLALAPSSMLPDYGTPSPSMGYTWLMNVLEYFRPLHCKYVLIHGGESGEYIP